MIKLAQDNNVTILIELKEIEAAHVSVDIVNRSSVAVVFTSFDIATLKLLSSISNYKLGWITNEATGLIEVESFIDWLIIGKNHVDKCVDYLVCAAWTIISDADLKNVGLKVDAVILDRW